MAYLIRSDRHLFIRIGCDVYGSRSASTNAIAERDAADVYAMQDTGSEFVGAGICVLSGYD